MSGTADGPAEGSPGEQPLDQAPEPVAPALPRAGSRRAEPQRRRGCAPVLIVVLLVLAGLTAGLVVGGGKALDKLKEFTEGAADYSGPGTGSLIYEVKSGDTSAAIGRGLKAVDVVKSVDAFTEAAAVDERSLGIQPGFYTLKKQMKAVDALEILVNSDNLIQARLTIPEGFRVKDIVAAIAKKTDITAAQVRAALRDPAALGLPASANGVVEGYLFPATYAVVPGETAVELLTQMIAKTKQVVGDLAIESKAKALGFTVEEIMTIASILEYEGSRDQDYPKIARAIYNRLDKGMLLQSDATVAYANNLSGTVWTTDEERANPSPYNTYVHAGLPPGPIGSPGEKTIEAALNPASGEWLYWLVVNLRTGETRFNETYDGHLADKRVLDEYCRTSDAC